MTIIDIWKRNPSIPLPTLNHHFFHVVLGVGILYGVTHYGAQWLDATFWIWFAFAVVELVSVIFLNETPLNAFNDVIQYSFVWIAYFANEREFFMTGIVALALVALYIVVTTKELRE